MTDPAQPTPAPNGNAFGAAQRIGQSLIGALPPAFLLLLLINAGVLWFIADQMDSRSVLAGKLIDACMAEMHAK